MEEAEDEVDSKIEPQLNVIIAINWVTLHMSVRGE